MQPSSGSKDQMKNMAIKDILGSLYKTAPGTHIIVVYPHFEALKEIYAHYIQRQLTNSEIVLILSYYDTVEGIKKYLEDFENGGERINVDKHLHEGSLLIVDSTKAFFNSNATSSYDEEFSSKNSDNENIVSVTKVLNSHSKKLNKHHVTILVDLGCFFNISDGVECLLKYENSIPQMFKNMNLKQFCFYYQEDFEKRFSISEKAKLLDRHGRTVLMLDN